MGFNYFINQDKENRMRSKQVKHGMLFNHVFHSPLWFWNRGMRKRAVVQLFISYVSALLAYYTVEIIKHDLILKGRLQDKTLQTWDEVHIERTGRDDRACLGHLNPDGSYR